VDELEHVIREAFHIATNGRPGPVLVDLPKDMLNTKARFSGHEEGGDSQFQTAHPGPPSADCQSGRDAQQRPKSR
jgi:thiamine pyrophosphate-dependent acetolactate synthase large subunit-like protein